MRLSCVEKCNLSFDDAFEAQGRGKVFNYRRCLNLKRKKCVLPGGLRERSTPINELRQKLGFRCPNYFFDLWDFIVNAHDGGLGRQGFGWTVHSLTSDCATNFCRRGYAARNDCLTEILRTFPDTPKPPIF